ncbi:hypothetical protein KPL76_07270 [Subtercola sp. PAMC28395]|uniref:hypothetical protein n=1 Tax=Subtercola sp. PAMC28395 TaxID=2846775 RepID=UPI001C0B2556|nr:hypothetical protein [Subtercola sp. PAMC28395]QWT25134.1 hypothetical protein KPL76_07270 [Subtercola sp. PAMC28395]
MSAAETYTAHLVDDSGTQTREIEMIDGLPQKSFVLSTDIDGTTIDVVWELDLTSDDNTYRRLSGDGYGEGGVTEA